MAFYKQDIVDINLNTGNIHRSFLNHAIGYKNDDADRFGIRTFRDGVPQDLTGASCQAVFMAPNGSKIALTSYGTVSGNVAYVTLPPACYDYEGQFCLSIQLVGGGVTGTMRIVDGMVVNTGASGTVAPTSSVPTYQEIIAQYDAMVAATAAANGAIAATYSGSATYKIGDYCIHDGGLYRCTTAITTAEAWNAAHWTATKIGPDVSDLKSALYHINPNMTDFITHGKNLFVPYELKKGIQISTTTHEEAVNSKYDTSGFMPVEAGVIYIIRYMSYLFYYDTGKQYVSTDANTYKNHYSFTPAQDGYVRFSNNVYNSEPNLYNTEHNIVAKATDYYVGMPYEYDLDEYYTGFKPYINSVNLIESLSQGYIRRTDGALVGTSGAYRTSNLIKIDPTKYYYWYNLRPDFGGFYDKYGAYISTSGNLTNPFKASSYVSGAEFVKVSGYNDQIVLSERPFGKYVPIGKKSFDESLVNLNAPVVLDVFLPPDFYVNKDRTIEIFNETLLSTPTADEFYFRWVATKGVNYKRKFVFTSNTVGDYAVSLRIYDKWFNIVFDGDTTIHVVNALSSAKTIVPIGDSLTNGKPWLRYIAEDLQNSGITFTGTRWHDTGSSISATIKHEGRSGWRASQYTGNNTYTFDNDGVSSANPFYNTSGSTFSWDYYTSTYNISADGVQFLLGTNGLNLAPQAEENAMYNMVSKIRSENANIPIFICYPIHAADQNGCARQANSDGYSAAQGMFYAEKKLAMWNFIQRLYTRLKDTSGVYFVPVCQTFDHEYMFGITDVPVNQYSEITEPMPTEGVHPRDYHQFIDPMYGAYCYAFNN